MEYSVVDWCVSKFWWLKIMPQNNFYCRYPQRKCQHLLKMLAANWEDDNKKKCRGLLRILKRTKKKLKIWRPIIFQLSQTIIQFLIIFFIFRCRDVIAPHLIWKIEAVIFIAIGCLHKKFRLYQSKNHLKLRMSWIFRGNSCKFGRVKKFSWGRAKQLLLTSQS